MPGDYIHVQAQNSKLSGRFPVTGVALSDQVLLTPKSANHQLFIQRIVVTYATHADKTLQFDDEAGTPVPILAIPDEATPATTGVTASHVVTADWGPNGLPLTIGKTLTVTGNASGSGSIGMIWVEGYEKLVGAVAVSAS
jgi:hypothetical protein